MENSSFDQLWTDMLFSKLWRDALKQPDKEVYIEEYGHPDWFNSISRNADEVFEKLENIHDVAHMSINDIITRAELTQSEFATKFCIPIRTVEDWCSKKRKCDDYLRLLFCRQLGFL